VLSHSPSSEKGPPKADFYAAAVYGSIVAAALISVLREEHASSLTCAITLVSTLAVFWAVHVWSEIVGERIELGTQFTLRHAGEIAREEWQLIEAAVVPTAILLLGLAGVLSDDTASSIAIVACVIQLFAWGVVVGRRAYDRWWSAILSGVGNAALGIVLVVLEVRVVH
jgi:hypothetical protein